MENEKLHLYSNYTLIILKEYDDGSWLMIVAFKVVKRGYKMDNIIDVEITQEDIDRDDAKYGCVIFENNIQRVFYDKLNIDELSKKLRINGANSDRVCMTAQCFDELQNKYIDIPTSASELIRNSILDDFVLCIETDKSKPKEYGGGVTRPDIFKIWFSNPTVESYNIRTSDNKIYDIVPVKDVVADESIYTLGFMKDEQGDYYVFITSPLYDGYKNGDLQNIKQFVDREDAGMIIRYIFWAWSYAILYKVFTNKPELLTLRTKPVAVTPVDGKKIKHSKKKKRNKVKIVKYTVINTEDINTEDIKSNRGKHEITCPAWGVAGHWRTYKKTGKKVWIAPYKKGKQRDNPDMYKSKDYTV